MLLSHCLPWVQQKELGWLVMFIYWGSWHPIFWFQEIMKSSLKWKFVVLNQLLLVCFCWDFLRIRPWGSSPWKNTIWDIFSTFYKHLMKKEQRHHPKTGLQFFFGVKYNYIHQKRYTYSHVGYIYIYIHTFAQKRLGRVESPVYLKQIQNTGV